MEPTESAAPDARLRVRRISGAWRRGATRTARSRGAGAIPGADSPQAPGTWGRAGVRGDARAPGATGTGAPGAVPGQGAFGGGVPRWVRGVSGSGGPPKQGGAPRPRGVTRDRSRDGGEHHSLERGERGPSWPSLPATVVGGGAVVLGAGFYRAFDGQHALFPSGTLGWSLALLTGVIVGHLVALGRSRWSGGTGSGAALTLAVLLLHGWVAAGMISLTTVVLVGIARPGRWRQGVLHGAVDILGIGTGALLLAACGRVPTVEDPWYPGAWTPATAPQVALVACAYLVVTRALLWFLQGPRGGHLPTVARTALVRQGLLAVALLGITPLICVVAEARPLLLPLFAIPLIALDSTLWIARVRAEEQLRDPLTGLPNRQWLLERTWGRSTTPNASGPGPPSC